MRVIGLLEPARAGFYLLRLSELRWVWKAYGGARVTVKKWRMGDLESRERMGTSEGRGLLFLVGLI